MSKAICEDCGSLVEAELTHNGVCQVGHYVHCGWGHQLSPDDLISDAAAIEILTEQLEAACADAKEAEAYAEELERDLKTCRMAQAVMENGIAEAEKERDDYAFKLADANNTYSEMHVALEEANDKLATCEKYRDAYAECDRIGTQAVRDLEAKLALATWLLTEAAVQLEEGKIKTRRNRAAIIWNLLDEMKDEIEGEKG